jgi:hypothetical protein
MKKISTLSGAEEEFETAYNNPDVEKIVQGYEHISFNKAQISSGFIKCNALLLINPCDGTTLFKHAGPRSAEVFAGSDGVIGQNFQDNYSIFMKHAQTHGQSVIVCPVYGSLSRKRESLIEHVQNSGEEMNIHINVKEPVILPSANLCWDMLYEPQKGYLITRHYNDIKSSVYMKYEIPGLQPEKFADTTDIAETLKIENIKSDLKYQIARTIIYTNPQELEETLIKAQKFFRQDELHDLFYNNLSHFEGPAIVCCVSKFKGQDRGRNNTPPQKILECLDILSFFDNQDEETSLEYASAFIDCMENASSISLYDTAAGKLPAIKSKISNPKYLQHLEKREKDAYVLSDIDYSRSYHCVYRYSK